MVGLADCYRCLYGMRLGLQGEWCAHGCRYWRRCPHRPLGSFGHPEKPVHGWCLLPDVRFVVSFVPRNTSGAISLPVQLD